MKKRYIFLAILLTPFVWRMGVLYKPLSDPHLAQEKCEFGTGSTALYERLRGEAEVYLKKNGKVRLQSYQPKPKGVIPGPAKFADSLDVQVTEFAMQRPTERERIAAIHALMRQYGLEFRFATNTRYKPTRRYFDVQSKPPGNKHSGYALSYKVQLPKLNWLCPLCYIHPEARLSIVVVDKNNDQLWNQADTRLKVFRWALKATPIFYQSVRELRQVCPRIIG